MPKCLIRWLFSALPKCFVGLKRPDLGRQVWPNPGPAKDLSAAIRGGLLHFPFLIRGGHELPPALMGFILRCATGGAVHGPLEVSGI